MLDLTKQEIISLDLALGLAIERNENIKEIDEVIYNTTKQNLETLRDKFIAEINSWQN